MTDGVANRTEVIQKFLVKTDWQHARYQPMAADASFRSYVRLTKPSEQDKSAILMNAPPQTNAPVTSFIVVAEILQSFGFSSPTIMARDVANGLLLIEDLGDDLFADLCVGTPEMEIPLYEAAVDLLVDLSKRPAPAGLAPYSFKVYEQEAQLLLDWYLAATSPNPISAGLRGEYAALVGTACNAIVPTSDVLVYRDFHAENLLWLPDRTGLARVGLLDFQDALAGHPAYDLVSLLEDARRDTGTDLRDRLMARYLRATGVDATDFKQAYCTLGAQRNLKILGIFARLALRDGKTGYIDLMPRVWDHLMRDLSHPMLSDLRGWVEHHVPPPTKEVRQAIKERVHDT